MVDQASGKIIIAYITHNVAGASPPRTSTPARVP